MDELLAFLRACLDEDERVAREAVNQGGIGRNGEKHWRRIHSDRRALIGDMAGNVVIHGIDETWSPSSYQAEHVARWDPARVLAEVEAKRRILEMHADRDHFCGVGSIERDGFTWYEGGEKRTADIPCLTVRLLAQPYAGRPGWREEWRA